MDDDFKIISSPLSTSIAQDGMTIEVHICRGEKDDGWTLEVVDQLGGSTAWEEIFASDLDALEEVKQTIAEGGIASTRILFAGWTSCPEVLAAYGHVDLALDPQPYSGGLTTCEALWMGVPVITMPGPTFAGRHATSHMSTAGFPQFVATSRAGYVALAIDWANRLGELSDLRSTLRQQVRSSALCDADRFARDWLGVLQSIPG